MTSNTTGEDPTTAVDPVERLLATARDDTTEESFRVTGVMMQYYHACKRELWFVSRQIEIDRENAAVVRGTRVDDTAYGGRESKHLGMIAIDLLEDGRVVEVKPSSKLVEPARMQLAYYLWYLDRVADIRRDGVLAHPRERKRESVELTADLEARVEESIRGIHAVVTSETPPPAEEKPFCPSCAYHDFCWC